MNKNGGKRLKDKIENDQKNVLLRNKTAEWANAAGAAATNVDAGNGRHALCCLFLTHRKVKEFWEQSKLTLGHERWKANAMRWRRPLKSGSGETWRISQLPLIPTFMQSFTYLSQSLKHDLRMTLIKKIPSSPSPCGFFSFFLTCLLAVVFNLERLCHEFANDFFALSRAVWLQFAISYWLIFFRLLKNATSTYLCCCFCASKIFWNKVLLWSY